MEVNNTIHTTYTQNTQESNSIETTTEFIVTTNDKDFTQKEQLLESLSQKTNDDNFNKIISNHAKDMSLEELHIFSFILDESSSIDRYSDILLSPEDIKKSYSNDISTNKLNINSYEDIYKFIDSTIDHLEKSYKNNRSWDHSKEAHISQKFTELFKDIKDEYIDAINDDKSLLGEYMRTIKPLILEEAQEIEDANQLKIAMEIYGLDSGSNKAKFTFELMQEGYSQTEAKERTDAYASAGLISHSDIEEKFGIVVMDITMIGSNPVLKESMMEAYAQMDTKTLQGVVAKVNSFPRSLEDFKVILGKEGQYTPEEIIQNSKDYWEDKYGTTEQINNHFLKSMTKVNVDQRFTQEDLSYIKDGIQFLADVFNKNISNNENKTEDVKIDKNKIQKMVDDLLSLIKTGLTVSELETIQRMLTEINEKRKTGEITEEELKEMMQELEKAIMALKKKIIGEAILEASDGVTTKQSNDMSKNIKGFEQRLNNITKAINELRQGNTTQFISKTYTNEELRLLQEIKDSSNY